MKNYSDIYRYIVFYLPITSISFAVLIYSSIKLYFSTFRQLSGGLSFDTRDIYAYGETLSCLALTVSLYQKNCVFFWHKICHPVSIRLDRFHCNDQCLCESKWGVHAWWKKFFTSEFIFSISWIFCGDIDNFLNTPPSNFTSSSYEEFFPCYKCYMGGGGH